MFSIIYIALATGLVFLEFWYWYAYAYQWWTVPVMVSFIAVGWSLIGILGMFHNRWLTWRAQVRVDKAAAALK